MSISILVFRCMSIIHVKIDRELAMEFRRKVLEVKGVKKGALTEAVEEAIRLWLEKYGRST